jgi:hypothetical protein
MTSSNSAVDVTSTPKFLSTWKSNLPIAMESAKLHPLLVGTLVASSVIHAIFPLAGVLCSVASMICLVFIEYTIMQAVWSNINEGRPRYLVTNSGVQWNMVLTLILVNFLTILLSLLLVLPGIWFAIKSSFSLMAVCLEDKGSRDAISRSHQLTKGNFLITFWFRSIAPALIVLSLFIVVVIVGIIITVPIVMVSKQAASMVNAPMQAIFLIIFYAAYLTMVAPMVHLYAHINRKSTLNTADDLAAVQERHL